MKISVHYPAGLLFKEGSDGKTIFIPYGDPFHPAGDRADDFCRSAPAV